MYQLVRAVAYMNTLDVIHRDIKPQNCLIFSRNFIDPMDKHGGSPYILKIADLGLARSQVCGLGLDLTNPVYTLWYRSPEILLGSKHYDDKSDAWAVGATIYEMIMREPLFPADDELTELIIITKQLGPIPQKVWSKHYRLDRNVTEWLPSDFAANDLAIFITRGADYAYSSPLLYPHHTDPNLPKPVIPDWFLKMSDLIHMCLKYDPNERWNCSHLLNHTFFEPVKGKVENDKLFKVPNNLRKAFTSSESCKYKKCLMRKKYPSTTLVNLSSLEIINAVVQYLATLDTNGIMTKTGHTALYIYFSYISTKEAVENLENDPILIAATSFLIASNLIKLRAISINKLLLSAKLDITKIISMRKKILLALAFNLYVSTSYDFMSEYVDMIDRNTESSSMKINLKKLATRFLMAAVPLGFNYDSDVIALACIKRAFIEMHLRNLDQKLFNSELNQKIRPLLLSISANDRTLMS